MLSYRWYIAVILHIKSVPAGCEELAERPSLECRAGMAKKSKFFKLLEVPLSFTVKRKKQKRKKKDPAASGKRTKLPWIILFLPVTKTDLCYFPWASDRG